MKLRAGEWIVLAGAAFIAAFAILVGVLIYLKPPPVEFAYTENAAAQAGEAIYRREGCNSCHRVHGNGATYGPSLDGVGSRRSGNWLKRYLRAPNERTSERAYRVKMPSYDGLQTAELDALVAYLQALRSVGRDGAIVDPPPG